MTHSEDCTPDPAEYSSLPEIDQRVQRLLCDARANAGARSAATREIYVLLRGPVIGFAMRSREFARLGDRVPHHVTLEETQYWLVSLLSRALKALESSDWEPKPAFGLVNPRKGVRDATSLRACLTTAVIREAGKGLQAWLKEHPDLRSTPEPTDGATSNPAARLEAEEFNDKFWANLAKCPSKVREPFVYHCVNGWPLRAIAKIVGTSHAEVHRRVERAKSLMRTVRDDQ